MAGALDGFRVIDFGQYIAGPLVGMLMADQGADVIKVDPPGGPRWKTPANATWNRGKRSIVLDLKQAGDLATAKGLVQGADVVVENFRPGVMDRLGLGATAMTEANPRLVYLSLPGFASDDPRASTPAWEGILGAATATYRPRPSASGTDHPVYTAIPISSNYGAFQGAVATIMALISRERDGVGQRVEVPLFDATFASIGRDGMRVHNPQDTGLDLRGIWGGHFQCKDGRWVRFGGTGNQNLNEFVKAAGITSWHEEGLTDLERLSREPDLAAEVERRVKELFKTRTAQEWEDLVAEAGSECTVCRTSEEWFSHPHALESKMVIEVQDPTYGRMLQPGINARMSLTPGEVRRPAPAPDQHREEILSEVASQRPAATPRSIEGTMRSVLDGVKVLDLCIILAGPTCGRTLAEYGADVIKIDNPSRGSTVSSHNEVNRAKRSILLDLKTEEGLDVFWRLLEDTDVVAQNYRAGKMESLGLGYEEVRKRKPDIIYVSLNAFGHLGPWAGRPGHEGFAQATTGMDRRLGGDGPPTAQPNAINDYGTGFMGAYGVALALLHRLRTGQGQHVDSALAYTAMIHQSPYMQLYEGKTWDETRGLDALGNGPLHRAYQAKDGWLFIGAQEYDLPRMAGVDGLSGIDSLQGEALTRSLEERFQSDTVQAWVQRLNDAGIGAHRVLPALRELLDDPWVIDHGLSITREHDEIGLVTGFGPSPRLSRTPVAPGRPAPKPGAQGREILEEIGLGQEFDRLLEQGVILTDGVAAG
ncbi:MAG: CoA transferase [Chloroflexi bacterium]|nr:CoA transferase [Chloroflexota bacterium]